MNSIFTHTYNLNLPNFPIAAQRGHVFLNFPADALISIGSLCDHRCILYLDDYTITILRHSTNVLQGHHTPSSPHLRIDLIPTMIYLPHQNKCYARAAQVLTQTAYTVVSCSQHTTVGQRIALLHAVLRLPALSTLCQALDVGFINSLPEITSMPVRKYPPPSITMIKDHLDQIHTNQRST